LLPETDVTRRVSSSTTTRNGVEDGSLEASATGMTVSPPVMAAVRVVLALLEKFSGIPYNLTTFPR
jgi:hypothetical protein